MILHNEPCARRPLSASSRLEATAPLPRCWVAGAFRRVLVCSFPQAAAGTRTPLKRKAVYTLHISQTQVKTARHSTPCPMSMNVAWRCVIPGPCAAASGPAHLQNRNCARPQALLTTVGSLASQAHYTPTLTRTLRLSRCSVARRPWRRESRQPAGGLVSVRCWHTADTAAASVEVSVKTHSVKTMLRRPRPRAEGSVRTRAAARCTSLAPG